MLITIVRCHFCDHCGDEGYHRVAHDDLSPPDPRGTWGIRCPVRNRLLLIDVKNHHWRRPTPDERRYLIPIDRQPEQTLLDLMSRGRW